MKCVCCSGLGSYQTEKDYIGNDGLRTEKFEKVINDVKDLKELKKDTLLVYECDVPFEDCYLDLFIGSRVGGSFVKLVNKAVAELFSVVSGSDSSEVFEIAIRDSTFGGNSSAVIEIKNFNGTIIKDMIYDLDTCTILNDNIKNRAELGALVTQLILKCSKLLEKPLHSIHLIPSGGNNGVYLGVKRGIMSYEEDGFIGIKGEYSIGIFY